MNASLSELWREVNARRIRRERVARLAILALTVFVTIALFYSATN